MIRIRLINRDGEVDYIPEFLAPHEASSLLRHLRDATPWQDEVIAAAGRRVRLPRAVCWFGDPGVVYPYAGFTHRPEPWTPVLLALKQQVESFCDTRFNGALANLYRDGHDAMAWHVDAEPTLDRTPLIASLSLGAKRPMQFRHRASRQTLTQMLAHGSLLIMSGPLQQHWEHAIPPKPEVREPRINLNFRHLYGEC